MCGAGSLSWARERASACAGEGVCVVHAACCRAVLCCAVLQLQRYRALSGQRLGV